MLRKRFAVAGVVVLAAIGVVVTVTADPSPPSTPDRPAAVNSAADARPGQTVAKDKDGRTLVYVDGTREADLLAAVSEGDGVVLGTVAGRVKAAVPADKLDEVAAQPGVGEVRLPDRAVPMAVTSEGVAASRANLWIQGGKQGAGVKVGVIDVGFGGLADAQADGELPVGVTVNNGNCADPSVKTPHGTAVAEIVHDMAPAATLYLACVEDTVSFSAAETWLRQQGVQVITAAVGFISPTGGRGDGTGPADSPADVVKRSRKAGILWSVAAGNQARLHFAGRAADANSDGWVEFNGQSQVNGFPLAAGATATVGIRWDEWPGTSEDLDLYVMSQAHPPTGLSDPDLVAVSLRPQKDTPGGLDPTEQVTFTAPTDPAITRPYWVYVKKTAAQYTTTFDLFVAGSTGQLQTFTEAGSITEPATSPYAMAVGATAPGSGTVESYSSRGPTIDGRQKPDITGFDAVSTLSSGQLAGTSAAAAHVAGAAALLKSANPALDASQLQAALAAKASPKRADNLWGAGTLNLGTPDTVPTVTGAPFTVAQTQDRIHSEGYTAGQVKTLPLPNVPGDTTAVALTISARSDVDNVVDVTPGDPAASVSKATGLRVRGGNTYTSMTVFVPLGPDRSVRIRSRDSVAWVVVEYLGYFSPSQSTDTFFSRQQPQRVLDTRGYAGSPRTGNLGPSQTQDLQIRGVAGVPANASSVVVNVTGFEATRETFVTTWGANRPAGTTLSLGAGDQRSNLTVVPIAEDGKIRVGNGTVGTVGVAVDVLGWFAPGNGARYVTLPEATRIADTATGNGLPRAPIEQGRSAQAQVGGLAGIPASATAATLVVTGTEPGVGTDLTVRPVEAAWAPVPTMSARKQEPAAGLVLAPLGDSGKVDVRNERGKAAVSLDATGYFVGGAKADPTSVGNCVQPADAAGFVPLFDGRVDTGMEGWQTAGAKPVKRDGCVLETDSGRDVTWYSARTYQNDYTVRLDFLPTTATTDSGVFVMMPRPDDPAMPGARGLEVSIGPDAALDTTQTGSIVGFARGRKQPVTIGQWNSLEISVRWNQVTVAVNGFSVVQYVTTDPARINRNSYIGLQNHGDTAPVRFRNIRVKRDTPVYSGIVKGVNGRCLDITDGNPHQESVWMWPCDGGFAQVFTSPGNGLIQAGGRCLGAKDSGTANGTKVTLATCTRTASQQWIHRGTDYVNVRSGRCLTADNGDQRSLLHLEDCTGRAEQLWTLPKQQASAGRLVSRQGRCVDVWNNDPMDGRVHMWDCNNEIAQVWTAPGDGTLRADGKCLDVTGGVVANGSPVGLFTCALIPAMQWVMQPDGSIVNPQSNRCLTAVNPDHASALSITDCGTNNRQKWTMTEESVFQGAIVGPGTKCLDVAGDNPNGEDLWLWECFGPQGQVWTAPGDGTLRAYGKCLDLRSLNNLTPVILWPCAPGVESQIWTTRPDGTIVNGMVNRCVDSYNAATANGNEIVIYDCHRGFAQRWSAPGFPV